MTRMPFHEYMSILSTVILVLKGHHECSPMVVVGLGAIKVVRSTLNWLRKKVWVEKSLNRQKSRTCFLWNFFPQILFWFIWKQRCYSNGWPLILKLAPNDEEWSDKITWFSWNWQKIYLRVCVCVFIPSWNVTVLKTDFYVKINQST